MIQKSFEQCRIGVILKLMADDVYEMGSAFRIEAHEVQMGIVMHSVIKFCLTKVKKKTC